ncbi:hypothetical protein THRCLA_20600 [Thraustotheca clavata]|uniref:Fibronectin type-III domain-containing protein n=1 Tax=Thraustotheca clavata TaxID=74557 RepID=A0A1W0A650_9STRA|nr:hypothetical protein THRCLA_20600 [Thraustotheca clavata]
MPDAKMRGNSAALPSLLRISLLLLLCMSLGLMALSTAAHMTQNEQMTISTNVLVQLNDNPNDSVDKNAPSNSTGMNSTETIQAPVTTIPVATFNGTMHGVPGNPTNVKAVASDAQAIVSWDAPEDDGSDPIVEYEILSIIASTNTPLDTIVHVGSANQVPTSSIVPNLQNGISYAFKVRARNVNGVSTWSAKSDTVSPLHPPDLCTKQTCSGNGACFPIYAPQLNDTSSSAECLCKPGHLGHDCSRFDETIKYFWDVSAWSKCSMGCGGGIRQRSAQCVEIQTMNPVSEAKCEGLTQPTLTYICNGFECGTKIIEVSYEIEMFYEDILFSSKSEHAFSTAFLTEIASALQIPVSRLDIESIVRGSIRVTFLLLPPTQAGGKSLNEVVADLHTQIQNRTSTLRTQGTFARRVYPSGVKMSFMIAEQHAAGDVGDISIMGLIGTVLVSVMFISAFAYCLRKRHERILQRKQDRKAEKMKRMGIASSV